MPYLDYIINPLRLISYPLHYIIQLFSLTPKTAQCSFGAYK